jgi:hypothetical protein
MSTEHAGYHTSCFLEATDPPSCRCNHDCHEGGPAICTGDAAVLYRRLGHEEQAIEEGDVCRACAAAMTEFAERPRP